MPIMVSNIELTNNPMRNNSIQNIEVIEETSSSEEISSEETIFSYEKKEKSTLEKTKLIVLRLYAVFFHITIFSIFESLFFWYYITNQEDKALKNQFNDVIMLSNVLCLNLDLDLDPVYEYLREQRVSFNNNVPLHNTFVLNSFLLSFIVFLNVILKALKLNIKEENIKAIRNNSLLFLLLFIYEYLFFKNIIYNYKPKSISELTLKMFNKCINEN